MLSFIITYVTHSFPSWRMLCWIQAQLAHAACLMACNTPPPHHLNQCLWPHRICSQNNFYQLPLGPHGSMNLCFCCALRNTQADPGGSGHVVVACPPAQAGRGQEGVGEGATWGGGGVGGLFSRWYSRDKSKEALVSLCKQYLLASLDMHIDCQSLQQHAHLTQCFRFVCSVFFSSRSAMQESGLLLVHGDVEVGL